MYAIVDIETTGTNNSYNGITEIAVLIHDGTRVIDTWNSLVNPNQHIPSFITQLTGITNEMVENAPQFEDIAEELYHLLNNKIFVAHNASFDYGFIKSHFESCGYAWRSKKLCTVRLSRKLFPGHRRYGLEMICNRLGITIDDRHRAMGDATATAKLFSLILEKDDTGVIASYLKRNSKEQILPPHIDKQLIMQLPTSPGVYYFFDKQGSVIYVGKAKNIRSRVLGHFTFAEHHGRENELREHIHDISYELTGNELIALLLESEEIKRKNPRFNYAQKLWSRNYCIFRFTDQAGYIHLAIERFNRKKDIIKVFPDYLSAREILNKTVTNYTLCPRLCHLQVVKAACHDYQNGICKGACIHEESAEDYNQRVDEAIQSLFDDKASYFLFGKGRDENEMSAVLVEKGHYLGFGFAPAEYSAGEADRLRDFIKWRPDTPDVQRILMGWTSRHPAHIVPIRSTATAEQ